ncbi:nucleoside triphosphate pyrophosphohydrolase [Parvularcula oceani]|uniref:nucleoside triphosphate pyrophosphohydrolase n=1 Tax=Parvularcula oceani TaxID=1247963 RepID=UPI0004E2535A|nr:nucleoside triphosphate pyrophosphohydrolase [Parvularcula oceani]
MPFDPPEQPRSIDALRELMRKLRDPQGGCPWDVEQTSASIARYAIEEAYEVVDAIENGSDADLRDELGDLLLQVVFHSQMADERGAFSFEDVTESVVTKMVRRHPHVFGDAEERSAEGQTRAWEEIKAEERAEKGEDDSALSGLPVGLPALTRAEKLGKRAAKTGFDWPDAQGVIAKIREELEEVEEALSGRDEKAVREELGDLLFSVANLTRTLGVDGESALRAANAKFERRFRAVEARARKAGRPVEEHSLDELEAHWIAAKNEER